MTQCLINETTGHAKKEYFVEEKETANVRKKKKTELKRQGCMSFCMTVVNAQGQWMVRKIWISMMKTLSIWYSMIVVKIIFF